MSSNEAAPDNGVDAKESTSKAAAGSTTTKKATKKKTATKKTTKKKTTKRAKSASAGGKELRVRQIRSAVRRDDRFRRTLRALGIRHHQDEVVVNDTPAIRGMLHQVRHLIQVRTEES